jgi:predicted Ser/Thr protein kinase
VTPADEEQLAMLLSEMADKVAMGQPVDLDETCRNHPRLATDLRHLWGAVLITDVAGIGTEETPREPTKPWRGLALPTTLGDYRLEKELGRGGMGVVFQATQLSLQRQVAVKMILRGRLASDADLSRFLAEASATARLQHPNIVPVYDVGEIDGRPFFSMQCIRGETLSERLADGPLPEREAARIVVAAARAIGYAHRQGVLHRDVKPSNILLDQSGKPHVTDFGLAKQGSDDANLTHSGAVLGTPAYMSPEQAAGSRSDIGPASDIYSLGCVLYHALTGRPPLVANSPVELVLMVMEQDPPPPRALRPSLDRDLEMIAVRCLQKPIDLRYETADELADDLEAFLNDERVSASSGRFEQVIARLFRETHHAAVLENWGVLWMWHSLVLLVVCGATWLLEIAPATNRIAYAALWTIGLGTWAVVFWFLRRRLGPVTFVERQIAHVWAASMIGIAMLFPLEWWLKLPPLTLSPVLGVLAAMVFLVKAGMFSGLFYVQTVALLITAVLMAVFPAYNHLLFGVVSAACFFIPGRKYYLRRRKRERTRRPC